MKRGKVLIVDDDALVRELLHDILEQEGYSITAVDNAAAAVKEARQRTFDLLITDLVLPEVNGLELVQKIREISPQTLPMLITAHPSLETVGAAIPQGVHNYIVKPFSKVELCMAVDNALAARPVVAEDKKRAPREGAPPHKVARAPEPKRAREEDTPNVTLKEVTKETAAPRSQQQDTASTAPTVVQALRNCELFEALSDQELAKVAAKCQEQTYEPGESIFRQGERAQKLLVIYEGSVSLQRSAPESPGEQTTIDVMERGEVIGWATLVEPRVHASSAICLKRAKMFTIEGAELRYLLDQEPGAGFEVMKRLAVMLHGRLRAHYGEGKGASAPGPTDSDAKLEGTDRGKPSFGASMDAGAQGSNPRKPPIIPLHPVEQPGNNKAEDDTKESQFRLNL